MKNDVIDLFRHFFAKLCTTSRRLYEVAEFLLLMFTNIPKRLNEKTSFGERKTNTDHYR